MQKVLISSELIRSPSISKMQAQISGNVKADGLASGDGFTVLM